MPESAAASCLAPRVIIVPRQRESNTWHKHLARFTQVLDELGYMSEKAHFDFERFRSVYNAKYMQSGGLPMVGLKTSRVVFQPYNHCDGAFVLGIHVNPSNPKAQLPLNDASYGMWSLTGGIPPKKLTASLSPEDAAFLWVSRWVRKGTNPRQARLCQFRNFPEYYLFIAAEDEFEHIEVMPDENTIQLSDRSRDDEGPRTAGSTRKRARESS